MLVNEKDCDILSFRELFKSIFNDRRLSLCSRSVSEINQLSYEFRTVVNNQKVLLLFLVYVTDSGEQKTSN